MIEVLKHRVEVLEDKLDAHVGASTVQHEKLETRVRVLEIAHGKLVGYAAGGAFIGGLVFQLAKLFFGR